MIGRLLLCFLPMVALLGCSSSEPATFPVSGVVRFTDGKLLRQGSIEFEALQREPPITATGEIGPDGSFVLGTYTLDDGAVAGEHRIVVISDSQVGNGVERPGLIDQSRLHPKYRDYLATDLKREVKKETNHFVIEVQYAPEPKEGEPPPEGTFSFPE